jgi:hypothetical protein
VAARGVGGGRRAELSPEIPTHASPPRASKTRANQYIQGQIRQHERVTIPVAEVVKEPVGEGGTAPAGLGANVAEDVVVLADATVSVAAARGAFGSSPASSPSSSSYEDRRGDKTTGVPSSSHGSPQFSLNGDDLEGGDDVEDLFADAVTDAEASTYLFVERLSHYMERRVICDGNRKTVELAIMIEAGSMVRERHQMKKEERERTFLSQYSNIICSIPNSNFKGPSVCQEMLCYYKGARKKEMDGGRVWRYYEDQLNEVKKFAYKFPGVSNISQLPSGTNQLRQMRRAMVVRMWKEKHPVRCPLADCCLHYVCVPH